MPARATAGGDQTWIGDLYAVGPHALGQAGGKAVSLAALRRSGLLVPGGLCVFTGAYDRFLDSTGLRPAITLELGRKRFEDMRWEEVWDASLRIRNLFLRASLEPLLAQALEDALRGRFGDGRPAVVRSSAPAEDTAATSFAGLHESYVNVKGVPALLEAVRQVWASLWSDRALLYRNELGLDVFASSMAVVVQELITGEVSGIAFSVSPLEDSQAVVEAVWGLNEGLVDGTLEPDRWIIERATGALVERHEPIRLQKVASDVSETSGAGGTRLVPLDEGERISAPLTEGQLRKIVWAALEAERLFGLPQDMEWTIVGDELWILQSRPISTLGTTSQAEADAIAHERAEAEALGVPGASATSVRDERPWYLSLHKSFSKLRDLRYQVEQVAIPQMEAEADAMASIDLGALSAEELATEAERRQGALARWEEVYYRDFIPLAHGVRLFGQVYNDKVRPEDPHEFIDLLAGSGLLSVSRNARLSELAAQAREAPDEPTMALDDYLDRFGSGPGTPEPVRAQERVRLLRLLSEMAAHPDGAGRRSSSGTGAARATSSDERVGEYLSRFEGEQRRFQEDLLDLARASYRLRDDDNVHLDRIRRLTEAALAESSVRAAGQAQCPAQGQAQGRAQAEMPSLGELSPSEATPPIGRAIRFKARQLVGQPAGPGIAVGRARVVIEKNDLFSIEAGEILVCDSLDPTMTFVAPLVSAIVERRGGMLVHGAIIAREYGLPCVTGVPDATSEIHTGDSLTVDGFLGIVVVGGVPPAGDGSATKMPPRDGLLPYAAVS